MPQYSFGTGQLFNMPVGGGAPLRVGALQDVSVDFSSDTKMLYGQNQFPLDVARGKTKIEGKAGTGEINASLWNNLFFGQTLSTGQKKQIFNEAATVPGTPFEVTVAQAATFFMDLGVYDQTTGTPYTQVAATPDSGEYAVSAAGVYTFNTADTGADLFFNYLYTDAATGTTIAIANLLMGNTPKFQMVLSQEYDNKFLTMVLYSCVSEKLSMPLKQDDYQIPEIDFSAQANDAGNIGFISVTG